MIGEYREKVEFDRKGENKFGESDFWVTPALIALPIVTVK